MQLHVYLHADPTLEALITHFIKEVQFMTAALDQLSADVAAQTTVVASVTTLLSTLSAQLAAAAASNDPQAAILAVKDNIDANTAALSAAVTANTPTTP